MKRERLKHIQKKRLYNKIEDLTNFFKDNTQYSNKDIQLLRSLKSKIDNDTSLDNQISILKEEKIRNNEYIWNSLVRDIVDYFIKDVTLASMDKIEEYGLDCIEKYGEKTFISDSLITFSENGKEIDKKIKAYIDNRIVNSYDVNRFDGKATFIIKQLFNAYYTNPRQMPENLLEILASRITANSIKYDCKIYINKINVADIKFKSSHPRDIDKLVDLLKLNLNKNEVKKFRCKYRSKN